MAAMNRRSAGFSARTLLGALVAACWLPASGQCEAADDYDPASLAACGACHGAELQGDRTLLGPNLSVLSVWYMERQLQNYKRGLRAPPGTPYVPGLQMQPMAALLDEVGIAAAARLVDAVPKRAAPATVAGDAERGAALYRTCTVCHGVQAEGNLALNAPRLAGQSDWYLVSQLQNYKAGIRGVHGDIWGAQMRASTGALADNAAIVDVVAYINTLHP